MLEKIGGGDVKIIGACFRAPSPCPNVGCSSLVIPKMNLKWKKVLRGSWKDLSSYLCEEPRGVNLSRVWKAIVEELQDFESATLVGLSVIVQPFPFDKNVAIVILWVVKVLSLSHLRRGPPSESFVIVGLFKDGLRFNHNNARGSLNWGYWNTCHLDKSFTRSPINI